MRLQKDKLEQVEVRRAPDGGYEVAAGGGGDSAQGCNRGYEDLPQHNRSCLRQQQSTEIRDGHRRSFLRVRRLPLRLPLCPCAIIKSEVELIELSRIN